MPTTIERLRALLAKAPPGPWDVTPTKATMLVASAVNALPALLDVAEAARALAVRSLTDPKWFNQSPEVGDLRLALAKLDGGDQP